MKRNVYILVSNKDKKERLVKYLNLNNKGIMSIKTIMGDMLFIEESHDFNKPFNYQHFYNQFVNERNNDISILVVNTGIFSDLDFFAKEFLSNTYCNVYDASSIVYYCFVTNEAPQRIDEFYSYFDTLDNELVKSVYTYLDNNLNALQTAKDLYIHRNTLNYRLNKFKYVTGVDIRTTQSASLIHSYRIRKDIRFIK